MFATTKYYQYFFKTLEIYFIDFLSSEPQTTNFPCYTPLKMYAWLKTVIWFWRTVCNCRRSTPQSIFYTAFLAKAINPLVQHMALVLFLLINTSIWSVIIAFISNLIHFLIILIYRYYVLVIIESSIFMRVISN
jgi:hypothetical protein